MAALVYLGDEVSGAGWRLAGAAVSDPSADEATAALEAARAQAPLVLLSAALTPAIDAGVLHDALAAPSPLVLVVPDLHGRVPLPDLAARLRAQLGLEA